MPEGVEHGSYPIHMELNDWAKNELGAFCESLFEEHQQTSHVRANDKTDSGRTM